MAHARAHRPHVPERAGRRAPGTHRRRDPRRGRGRAACPGTRRDGDRAARAPRARVVRQGPLQRAARLREAARRGGREGRRRLRRQLRARAAVGDGAAQPLRSRDRHAARDHRRHRHHRHAHRRGDRDRRPPPRAQGRARCWATSERAARRTGTCGCSTTSSTSTRSACIRAGPRAATPSPSGSRATSASRWSPPPTGSPACAAPTSSSRPRACPSPTPLLRTAWIAKGALVVPYGTMSAVELSLTDIMDKMVVDDWGQCRKGLPFGALRAHVDSDRLTEKQPARGARADRRGAQARPRARRRDDPALASRAQHHRHRARPRAAREGEARVRRASRCASRDHLVPDVQRGAGRGAGLARALRPRVRRHRRRRGLRRARSAAADRGAVGIAGPVLRLHVRLALRALAGRDAGDRRAGAVARALRRAARATAASSWCASRAAGRAWTRPSALASAGWRPTRNPGSTRRARTSRRSPRTNARRCIASRAVRSEPRPQSLDALRTGEVDVVALDSFWLDLVRRHDPARLAGIRCVATTRWTPMPLLVAARGVPSGVIERLRDHLVAAHGAASYAPLLADVLIERFVVPDLAAYSALEAMERDAIGRGYEAIR